MSTTLLLSPSLLSPTHLLSLSFTCRKNMAIVCVRVLESGNREEEGVGVGGRLVHRIASILVRERRSPFWTSPDQRKQLDSLERVTLALPQSVTSPQQPLTSPCVLLSFCRVLRIFLLLFCCAACHATAALERTTVSADSLTP